MAINFDRVAIKAVASAGLCAAAMASSPQAAADPLLTGGYHCVQDAAGSAAAGGAGGAAGAGGGAGARQEPVAGQRRRPALPRSRLRRSALPWLQQPRSQHPCPLVHPCLAHRYPLAQPYLPAAHLCRSGHRYPPAERPCRLAHPSRRLLR